MRSVLDCLLLASFCRCSLLGVVDPGALLECFCEIGSDFLLVLDLVQAIGLFCFGSKLL
jgi:hypothetical protein